MARATRASVRAGTAKLEAETEPTAPRVTRSTRARSASVATTASSNDELETRKKLLKSLPFARMFGASFGASTVQIRAPINGAYFVTELASRRLTVSRLTRPELEAVVETYMSREEAASRHADEQAQRITALQQREVEAASRISQLSEQNKAAASAPDHSERPYYQMYSRRATTRRKARDIRRHFSIEVPTQQKLLQDAAEASLIAEESSSTRPARLRPSHHDDQDAEQTPRPSPESRISTPRQQRTSSPQDGNSALTSPYSWNFSSIFDSVKKVFGASPTKTLKQLQARSSEVNQRNGLSPVQEESPTVNRSKNQNQSETDNDLSQIVRKRKAADAPATEISKKTKLGESSYHVPSESDSGDEVRSGRPFVRKSGRRHSFAEQPRTPAPARSTGSGAVTGPAGRRRRGSPEKKDHLPIPNGRGFSAGRRGSPEKAPPPRPVAEDEQPDQDTAPHTESGPRDTGGPQTPARDTEAAEPVTQTRRRTARANREQRENGAANGTGTPWSKKSAAALRPHFFEIRDYDSYTTVEAAEAAIDAMLAIEEAQEKGLPKPETSVVPAERIVPKITLANFLPSASKPKEKQTVDAPKPREPMADKREAVSKAREAERRRILERQSQLREEQKRMEEELKKYEAEEQANGEVGQKRKRVNVDELEFIPSRRPGQSTGTFALLDEFFDCDDSEIEIDESQYEMLTSGRPTKRARTESNIFDTSAHDGERSSTPASTPASTRTPAVNAAPQAVSVAASQTQASPAQPSASADGPTAPDYMSQALERKRSQVEKYKPKQGSSLREMQRLSSGSSATGLATPAQQPASATGTAPAAATAVPAATSNSAPGSAASTTSVFAARSPAPAAAAATSVFAAKSPEPSTAAATSVFAGQSPTPAASTAVSSSASASTPATDLFPLPASEPTASPSTSSDAVSQASVKLGRVDYTRHDTPFDPELLDREAIAFLAEKPSSDISFEFPRIPSTTSTDRYSAYGAADGYDPTPEEDAANLARFRAELAEFVVDTELMSDGEVVE